MKKLYFFFLLLCGTFFNRLDGQVIKGKIVDDATGETLIGANIVVKGTSNGTVTDFDGAFEIRVASLPATLTLS